MQAQAPARAQARAQAQAQAQAPAQAPAPSQARAQAQAQHRPSRDSTTAADARRAASTSPFRSCTADFVVRAPIEAPGPARVIVTTAGFRRRHPRLLLSSSHRRLRLYQSRRRRRRTSAEPRASRRADRTPPTSSCVRRSRRRNRVVRDHRGIPSTSLAFSLLLLCPIAAPALLSRADATTASARRAASPSLSRPGADDLVVRALVASSEPRGS